MEKIKQLLSKQYVFPGALLGVIIISAIVSTFHQGAGAAIGLGGFVGLIAAKKFIK